MDKICEEIGKFSKEMETRKKNQMEMTFMKDAISEMDMVGNIINKDEVRLHK